MFNHQSRLLWVVRGTMFVYITLGFFERPSWCYNSPCEGPNGEALPLSGIPCAFLYKNEDSSMENEDSSMENEDSSMENEDSSMENEDSSMENEDSSMILQHKMMIIFIEK